MSDDKPLTARQELFCLEYIKDFNGAQAAIRAGYSPRGASIAAIRLLSNAKIAARVREDKEIRIERVKVEADDVLRELLLCLKSSVADYEIQGGRIVTREGIDAGQLRAVSSVKHKTRRTTEQRDGEDVPVEVEETEFRLWDKVATANLLGKHLGLFPDRTIQTIEPMATDGEPGSFEEAAQVVNLSLSFLRPAQRKAR